MDCQIETRDSSLQRTRLHCSTVQWWHALHHCIQQWVKFRSNGKWIHELSWAEQSWTLKRSFYSGPWMETYKSCKESLCSGGYEWQAFLLTAETGTISWEVLWMFIDKSYKENFSEICLNKTKENLDHFHFVLHLYIIQVWVHKTPMLKRATIQHTVHAWAHLHKHTGLS